MRTKLLVCMLFAAMIALLATVAVGESGQTDRNSPPAGYNVLAERTFQGTVTNRGYLIGDLMYFTLKSADATIEVQIGPKEFLKLNAFELKAGDRVTVTGMPVVMNKRNVVLARKVTGANGSWTIRDEMGLPLWETGKPIQMDPERESRPIRICGLTMDN